MGTSFIYWIGFLLFLGESTQYIHNHHVVLCVLLDPHSCHFVHQRGTDYFGLTDHVLQKSYQDIVLPGAQIYKECNMTVTPAPSREGRNHKTCQQLQSISLETMGFGHLSCLKTFTERGLLFLMMASKSEEGIDCREDPNTGACMLFALNPKTSEMICLECFCLEERLNTVGTNGQYIAAGQQGTGKVNIWNITNSQSYATLQVFQDEVNSIGFHLDRPVIAFGSTGGCVHLFSLC